MNVLTTIGTVTVCCGVLFFLFCAGLVFWYLFNQPKQVVSDSAPEPSIDATIEHPSAGSVSAGESPSVPSETPGVDG
jgi:hypothetical protein